ncbi:MAG TPA: twitching motility protein PilT, partial [Deltaproteobacteria bacterium]|nr:twitching motility protein PilT [Deltaproteobacteria bacterium]
KNLLFSAIEKFRSQRGDFSDFLIGLQAKQAGAESLYTFDKNLRTDPFFKIL